MRKALAAESPLNIRLNEMKSITEGVVPVPPLDQSELEAKVIVYMGAADAVDANSRGHSADQR